ncbi:MAG: hypothetical protein ACK50A_05230 [Sphingobacteriaceae bacterium]
MSQIKDTLTNVTLSGVEVWHLVLGIFLKSLHIKRKINSSVENNLSRSNDPSTPLRMTLFRKIKNKLLLLRIAIGKPKATDGEGTTKQSLLVLDCFAIVRNDVFLIFISLLFMLTPFQTLYSNGDSLKTYPLNDPRNPNCPCHQYQKLADEEYKRMLGEQQIQVANNVIQTTQSNVTSSSAASSSKNSHGSHKLKRKKISARQKKFNRLIQVNNWKIFRRWKDPTACFKWR